MPVLAAFIGNIATFFVSIFARFLSYKVALRLGAYAAWLAVMSAFVTSVLVCMGTLSQGVAAAYAALGAPSASNWVGYGAMGIGMVIPSSAPSIIGCVASVWIATQVVIIQRRGIENFGK